jgi:hypothetical protein
MSRRPVTLAEAQHLREAGHSAERGADDAVQAVMDANMWELEVNALMGEVSLQEGASLFRRAQRALFEVKAVLDALEEQTVTAEDVPLAGLPPCGWNKKAVQLRFAAPALGLRAIADASYEYALSAKRGGLPAVLVDRLIANLLRILVLVLGTDTSNLGRYNFLEYIFQS